MGVMFRYLQDVSHYTLHLLCLWATLVFIGGLGKLVGYQMPTILLVSSVITLYTLVGGIKSVAATDVFRFFFMVIGFSLITYSVVLKTTDGQGILYLIRTVYKQDSAKLAIFTHHGLLPSLTSAFFVSFYPTAMLVPSMIQRILIVSKKEQGKKLFISFGCFYPIFCLLLVTIGFGLLLSGKNEVKEEASVMPVILSLFLKNNIYGQIILMCLVFSVIMSTVDSLLNAAVVVAIHDIVRPICRSFISS